MADQSLEKAMRKIIHGLQETKQRIEHNQQVKINSDISVPISLKDVLARLSKDELSEIRKTIQLHGVSHLKKGELIELLSVQIPLAFEEIIKSLDIEMYHLIEKIIRNGGYIDAPKLETHQFKYLRTSGIFFTGTFEGKKIIGMPDEIVKHPIYQQKWQELRSVCQRNTETNLIFKSFAI